MPDNSAKSLQSAITIAQTLLLQREDREAITPVLIEHAVDTAASLVSGAVDRQAAIEELIRRFSLWIGQDSTLVDERGHEPWLDAARKSGWRYWQRYQGWLERSMATRAVESLGESTDRILGLLEDPMREGSWDRRGLVVGHVQSGKTGNYSGLICKAADAGYKIIIVLAGLHNNLRSQTQIRLEEAFLGYETPFKGDAINPIGVGLIDSDSKILPNCATNRTNNGDFTTRVAQHCSISPEQRPWLFVVKKNKTVLERLLKWIRNHVADTTEANTGRRIVTNLPLLLIDDEADHASVDTGEQLFKEDGSPDDEHAPKAINSRIRKILHSFVRSAYVGYTATPFANIFIHRRNATTDEGPDLFPQSFIINLAAPSSYIGPSKLFGLRSPDGRVGGMPLIREISDHVDGAGIGGWMPLKHNKDHVPLHGGKDEVPPSLREAIASFVLVCATRVARGQGAAHCSMLVHVTRFNLVQREVHRQVAEVVRHMRQRITRKLDHENLLGDLKTLWDRDFTPTTETVVSGLPEAERPRHIPSWPEVLAALPDVLSDVDVRMINGTAKDALDYDQHSAKGLKVIAIGGDKLSRGLTLEGLSVSYFVRTSKMYDTLMQMGRWFGYRPGYIDLCRLYTSSDLVEWFGHIADASEELREEFDAMVESGGTPETYGLKVQSHPVLMVTSPLKMRSARNLQISFSGELLETVALHDSTTLLAANLGATNRLIEVIGEPSERDPRRSRQGAVHTWSGFLWTGVPAEPVANFLEAFSTHPKARKVNSILLADFVRAMVRCGELTDWTVVLMGGGTGRPHTFAGGLRVEGMLKRKRDEDIKDRYSIGRLLSPRDEAIDLDEPAWIKAMEMTLRSWTPDPARQRDGEAPTPPSLPSGPAIRRIRGFGATGVAAAPERGVLLLYPLDPMEAGLRETDTPVMAFGVSFPASVSGAKVEYKVDHLLWELEYGPAD